MTENNNFKIRLGNVENIFDIADVFSDSVRELCKDDYEPNDIEAWIASKTPESRLKYIKGGSLWVAESDRKIVGYLVSIPSEIIALFVSSSHSGLGIGMGLGKMGIEIARNNNSYQVKLESTITAVSFYKKMGFKELGRGFYTHDESALKLPIVNMILS